MNKLTPIEKENVMIFFLVLTFLTFLDVFSTYFFLTFLEKNELFFLTNFFISNFGLIGGLLIYFFVRMPINFLVSYLLRDYFYVKLIFAIVMGAVIIWNLI